MSVNDKVVDEMVEEIAQLRLKIEELTGANILNKNAVRLQREAREAAERRVRDAQDRLTGLLKGADRKDPLELETCVAETERRVAELEATVRGQRMIGQDDALSRAEMAATIRNLKERLLDAGLCTVSPD